MSVLGAGLQRLVIGLDYGTTYTGVAYCDSYNGAATVQDIQLVQDWPGTAGGIQTTEKVPSEVSYENGNITWGATIPPRARRQIWTKLDLDKKNKSDELRAMLALLARVRGLDLDGLDDDDSPPSYPGNSPVDVVSDFLKGVRQHISTVLERSYGKTLSSMRIDLVITVPAVWSDKAKDSTLRAVSRAGFNGSNIPYLNTTMVSEPEAAAIYTLKTIQKGGVGSDIKTGDVFILCDAGGGTVDLVSYRVRSVKPFFSVEEAAVGSGDKCGATFVDRNFIEWFKKNVGLSNFDSIPKEQISSGSRIMGEFEHAKMNFTGNDVEVFLPLPKKISWLDDDPNAGIIEGEIRVTHGDLQEMFDPCVNRTLELIDGQLAELRRGGSQGKYVFLVGGFGRSAYMYKKVKEYCVAKGMDAICPPFPWSAVARGAVARGLENKGEGLIYCRMLRRHYGTPISELFTPLKHEERDGYVDELTGEKFAKGCMHWLAGKGDSVIVSHPKRAYIECCRTFKPTESRVFAARLVACDIDDAPRRYEDDNVYNVAILHADLRSVPESKYSIATSGLGGEPFFMASFKIEIEYTDTMRFFLTFEGQEYGSVTAKYE